MPGIQPLVITSSETATSFIISEVLVNLFTNATIVVSLLNGSNDIVKTHVFVLSTQEYTDWAADDNYIINLIAAKIGATLSTP